MPGQPYPVLGSTLATVIVAVTAGFGVTMTVHWLSVAPAKRPPRPTAAVVGVAYAVLSIGLWAGVRAIAHPVSFSGYGGAIVFWLALAFLGATVLAGGTTYVYARFRYVAALLALFAATAFTWYSFLLVGGETDILWVWAFLAVPVLVAATGVALAGEWLLRRIFTGENSGGDTSACRE